MIVYLLQMRDVIDERPKELYGNNRSIRLSFLAVRPAACVLCPRTGRPAACLKVREASEQSSMRIKEIEASKPTFSLCTFRSAST